MTAQELETKIIALLGSSGAGVSSTMVQSAIDSALDDLARFQPEIEYVPVNLVAGVSMYAVPADTYSVLDVAFPDASGYGSLAEFESADLSEFHSHSLVVIIAQKWEQFENSYGYDWEYDIDSMSVLVMPTPQVNSKMLVRIAKKRAITEVPDSLLKSIEDLALSETMRSLAMTVGGGITSVPIGIGSVTFSSEKLVAQADALRTKALKRLGTSTGGGAVFSRMNEFFEGPLPKGMKLLR
jgi:hypothetical protein